MIFTKNPILGTAKTRIGNVKGDVVALNIYNHLLKYTRDITKDLSCKKVVYYNNFLPEEDIWDASFEKRMQVKGDLGAKMSAAFQEEFATSERIIIIGSDCAELSTEDIESAFSKLREHDLVIGPAEDGGYYLLGMNAMHLALFQEMPWSKEGLLTESLRKSALLGLSNFLMSTKSDIDHWEDWEKLGWELD